LNKSNIVILINSLSPTEKQYFKKSHDAESDFVKLFDYINKSKTYDSENAKKYLLKKRKSNKTKNYTSGHLSVLKSYLYDKILESLRSQHTSKRASYELMTKSVNVDILLEKGLYNLAKNEINDVKNKAQKSSFHNEKLMLYRRASIKDVALLQSFINEDYMQDESFATEFGTKYLFYWVHAQFAEFQGQPEKAIEFFEKTILTWFQHPDYIKAHPRMYLGTCTTYLKYILQQKKSYTLILKESDFKFMLSKIPSLGLQKDVETKWNLLFSTAKILAHRLNNNYAEIPQEAAKILESKESLTITTNFTKVMIFYFVALTEFQQKNYKVALQHLHDMVYTDSIKLNANPEYHVHVLRIYLMTQFELGNYKFLKPAIKKIKQQLQQNDLLDEFESLFLKMISQLISARFLEKQDGVFARFYPQMNDAIIQNGFKEQVDYQYVMKWIEQKEGIV